jgi:hypothetical protein
MADGVLGDGWTVVSDDEYAAYVSGHELAIQAWSELQASRALLVSVRDGILMPAIDYGNLLIREFASENILMGITQAGMTSTVRLVMSDVITALGTGSLYDAIHAARAIPVTSYDSTFITQARILQFINKVEAYLGLPPSGEI